MTDQRRLSGASLRLLKEMAGGAVVFAALNEPRDFERGAAMFSELVGCRVWKNGAIVRRVRSSTLEPLYMNGFVAHEPGASGDRQFEITCAGYDATKGASLSK